MTRWCNCYIYYIMLFKINQHMSSIIIFTHYYHLPSNKLQWMTIYWIPVLYSNDKPLLLTNSRALVLTMTICSCWLLNGWHYPSDCDSNPWGLALWEIMKSLVLYVQWSRELNVPLWHKQGHVERRTISPMRNLSRPLIFVNYCYWYLYWCMGLRIILMGHA